MQPPQDRARLSGDRHLPARSQASPPLGPGQQRAIAIEYRRTGDKRLANLLVETNMRLVTKLAWQHSRFDGRLVPDLV